MKTKAPKGDLWLHEIKFDGYRIQVHLNRDRKKVFTRNGLDVTSRTVDTHVAALRRKLGHAPDEAGYIVTVAKAGYRLRREI